MAVAFLDTKSSTVAVAEGITTMQLEVLVIVKNWSPNDVWLRAGQELLLSVSTKRPPMFQLLAKGMGREMKSCGGILSYFCWRSHEQGKNANRTVSLSVSRCLVYW